ncbi:glycosyltransferase family 4 protein [Chloroflexus sp.]|uniref:glycosyltransferase family 4 protein n=1 Tax=Chloroflexus sp. TaxID=1904827 RepID=UPI00298EE7A4|nr:glycosyltransferase family 4 protein [Chloroflexus sp.]MDW8405970.1 glycosyltransferase family 4 protein [Chloroflexus sp.]
MTPRIAYCSPVNPAPSGISDYSEELLPYLAQYAEITLFVEDGLRPTNPQLGRHFTILPIRKLERLTRRGVFDAVIYHMGNSPAHAGIWRVAQRVPGVIVLHDFVLHHFMLWYAANVQRDVQRYVAMMRARYGAEGEHIAQLMIRSRFSEAAFSFPCNEDVLAAAKAVVGHSRYLLERVAALRPDLPRGHVPMGVPLPPLIDRNEARRRLGISLEQPLLATFGHINAWKRIEPTLRALAALRSEGIDAHCVLVGSISPNYDLKSVIQRLGLQAAVTVTGYVERAQFEDYVAATDVCLNLRYPTAGETSASLLRLLGAGKPTLVSAVDAFCELPPDVAAQVDVDANETDLIVAYCRRLLRDPALAAALGARARAYVAANHTLPGAAQALIGFLAEVYGWPAPRLLRAEPLWDPAPPLAAVTTRASPAQPVASPPSLLVQAAARAAAEIGLTEDDTAALRSLAARIAELEP